MGKVNPTYSKYGLKTKEQYDALFSIVDPTHACEGKHIQLVAGIVDTLRLDSGEKLDIFVDTSGSMGDQSLITNHLTQKLAELGVLSPTAYAFSDDIFAVPSKVMATHHFELHGGSNIDNVLRFIASNERGKFVKMPSMRSYGKNSYFLGLLDYTPAKRALIITDGCLDFERDPIATSAKLYQSDIALHVVIIGNDGLHDCAARFAEHYGASVVAVKDGGLEIYDKYRGFIPAKSHDGVVSLNPCTAPSMIIPAPQEPLGVEVSAQQCIFCDTTKMGIRFVQQKRRVCSKCAGEFSQIIAKLREEMK